MMFPCPVPDGAVRGASQSLPLSVAKRRRGRRTKARGPVSQAKTVTPPPGGLCQGRANERAEASEKGMARLEGDELAGSSPGGLVRPAVLALTGMGGHGVKVLASSTRWLLGCSEWLSGPICRPPEAIPLRLACVWCFVLSAQARLRERLADRLDAFDTTLTESVP